jgi:hypothetical protein
LRRRAEPGPTGKIEGVWQKGQLLGVWARVGEWLLLVDPSEAVVVRGWSHVGFVESIA